MSDESARPLIKAEDWDQVTDISTLPRVDPEALEAASADRRRDEDPRHTFVTGPDRVCARCGLDSDATVGLDERAALVCPVDRRRSDREAVERFRRALG
jgi:hypothetical protein